MKALCPHRLHIEQINDMPVGEYFMLCDGMNCPFCAREGKSFRCDNPKNNTRHYIIGEVPE
jgi:hypothetical protein